MERINPIAALMQPQKNTLADTPSTQNPNSELDKYGGQFNWEAVTKDTTRQIDDRLSMLRDLWSECARRQKNYEKEAADLNAQRVYQTRTLGGKADKEIVGTMIFEASEQFNFKEDMNLDDKQIDFIIIHIFNNYPYLKLEEIAYFLKGGVSGRYGTVEFRLDSQTVIGWAKAYVAQKSERLSKS